MAFSSGGDRYDLMEILLDGSVSPLLATSRQEHSASWSTTDRQYVYVSNAAGSPAIWLRTAGENSARPVVESNAQGHLDQAQPRFSPDGQRIAYVRMGDRHAVWIRHISGGPDVPLEQESSDQHGPAWSPDGTWIVYARFLNQKWEIAKSPSGGGRPPVRITAGGGSDTTIEWSSTGEWICFQDSAGIHLVAPDGSGARLLHGPAAAFALSQNADLIYIAKRGSDRGWVLASFRFPGGERAKTIPLGLSSEAEITDVFLNPDGKKFAASVRFRKRDIWILDGLDVPHGFLGGLWSR
jgi:dipeptidyl aminopeptidase/acylaminoacyl peptidase